MGFVVLFLRKAGPSDLIPFYNNVLAFSVYCMLYMQYEEKGAIFIFTILEKKKPRLNNLGEVTELILQSWDLNPSNLVLEPALLGFAISPECLLWRSSLHVLFLSMSRA